MTTAELVSITIYPLKSAAGCPVTKAAVMPAGLQYDRMWAVAAANGTIITAREAPLLLSIRTVIEPDGIRMIPGDGEAFVVPLSPEGEITEATVFGIAVEGIRAPDQLNERLSDYLGFHAQLLHMPPAFKRLIKPKHGGKPGDTLSYADTSPVMLLGQESLDHLNAKLDAPVNMNRFRPNLVIRGLVPGEEEQWSTVRIGDVIFEATEPCKRCVFITIDPDTLQRDAGQQPLRTLAGYKPHPRGGVSFGLSLVPRSEGIIRVGDAVSPA